MANNPSSDNLLLGRGMVYFDRFDDSGNSTGLRALGNVETFEIQTTDETKDQYESMTHKSALYKRVPYRRTVTVNIKGDELNPKNLAMAIMGDEAYITQAATAIVAEPFTNNAQIGGIYRTAKLGPISSVVVKKASTSLTLGTDYLIADADVGLIQLIGSMNWDVGDTLTVGYTPTAYAGTAGSPTLITGGTSGTVEGHIFFDGDPVAGEKVLIDVWHVTIEPNQALGFIPNDFAEYGLQATVLDDTPNHPTSPLFRVTNLSTAN